jgi:hypothetical protein
MHCMNIKIIANLKPDTEEPGHEMIISLGDALEARLQSADAKRERGRLLRDGGKVGEE